MEPAVIGGEEITSCPSEMVGADREVIEDMIEGAEFAKKRLLPCGGGTLDQTPSFFDAIQVVWATTVEIRDRAKRGRTL